MEYLTYLLFLLLGLIIGIIIVLLINAIKIKNNENKATIIIEKAKKEAEIIKRDALMETKEKVYELEKKADLEIAEKKIEIKSSIERLSIREENLERRDELLQKRELMIEEKEQKNLIAQNINQEEKEKLQLLLKEENKKLEEISRISSEEAKNILFNKVKEECNLEFANYVKEQEKAARLDANEKGKYILVSSMQKYSTDVACEETVTTVDIPNEEMKGRLIGREGRNIRTIEAITGVDLIIDDTPGAVVLSCFDPLRREIAKITLETMVKDGRIFPSRIEELYDKVTSDINEKIKSVGKEALMELGIPMFEEDLISIIGRLKYRSSYGQNALKHSIEVAYLSGNIAAELGEDVTLARRAGLLHDIGKAINTEIGGSHVEIGKEIAKKYKEEDIVINSIASHHGDEEATSVISSIVAIADTLSAARPGARRDSSETYFKRLEQLEAIANDFQGVEKTFAVQAGRELRVIVKPEIVDDLTSFKIAREIKARIESEMNYPGTIKIVVIRETRNEQTAK